MSMNDKLKEIFSRVQAEEELKISTKAFVENKTHGYTTAKTQNSGYIALAAACACVLIFLFGGYWLYFTPTAEIGVDINPSIELSVNRFDRVVSAKGYNEDGQELLKTLDIKFKSYTAAIEDIMNDDKIKTLMSDNEIMTITVAGSDEARSSELLSKVEDCASQKRNTYCYSVSSKQADEAHDVGLSCGKYRAYLQAKLIDPSITPEKIQGMTMREIRDLTGAAAGNSESGAGLQHEGSESMHHSDNH